MSNIQIDDFTIDSPVILASIGSLLHQLTEFQRTQITTKLANFTPWDLELLARGLYKSISYFRLLLLLPYLNPPETLIQDLHKLEFYNWVIQRCKIIHTSAASWGSVDFDETVLEFTIFKWRVKHILDKNSLHYKHSRYFGVTEYGDIYIMNPNEVTNIHLRLPVYLIEKGIDVGKIPKLRHRIFETQSDVILSLPSEKTSEYSMKPIILIE